MYCLMQCCGILCYFVLFMRVYATPQCTMGKHTINIAQHKNNKNKK